MTTRQAFSKFGASRPQYRCPVCSQPLTVHETSLVCSTGHTYDINRKGYVDLRRTAYHSDHYTADFFEARRSVLEAGLYTELITTLRAVCERFDIDTDQAADVGCGDGFITRALGIGTGIDISLEGIAVAARGGGTTRWVCADGAQLPLVPGTASSIFNIFAPARYDEFAAACPQGLLVKVIPGSRHMRQLRSLVGLESETHSQAQKLFEENVTVIGQFETEATVAVDETVTAARLLSMSPVGFSAQEPPPLEKLTEITTHSHVLVGRLP